NNGPQDQPTCAPTVSELAEQIRALRASHCIEAAPERTGKRRPSGERPVTARVRRQRANVSPATESGEPTECESQVMNGYKKDSQAVDSPAASANVSTPDAAHQERLANSRLPKQRQRSLWCTSATRSANVAASTAAFAPSLREKH